MITEPPNDKVGLPYTLQWIFARLGWKHLHNWIFQREGDTNIDLLCGGKTWIKHELRRSARWSCIKHARLRTDMPGIADKPISSRASTIFLRPVRLKSCGNICSRGDRVVHDVPGGTVSSIIRSIVAGATYTGQWKANAGLINDTICPCCATETHVEIDTHEHRLTCSSLQHIITRELTNEEIQYILLDKLRARTTIMHEPNYIETLRYSLASRTHLNHQTVHLDKSPFVYTDGACKDQSIAEIRTAACGVWAQQGNLAASFALPGPDQSAVRAEIYAAWWALKFTVGKIIIVTDNQYVCDTLKLIIANPFHTPRDHLDLWSDTATMLIDREVDTVKVKAHRLEEEVRESGDPIEIQHFYGNQKADELAVRGVVALPEPDRRRYMSDLELNYTVQATIARVIHERARWDKEEDDAKNKERKEDPAPQQVQPVRKRLWVKTPPALYITQPENTANPTRRLLTKDIELKLVSDYPNISKPLWDEFYCIHPNLKSAHYEGACAIKDANRKNPRDVLGTTYPATLYDPLLKYWSTVKGCIFASESGDEVGKGTTWLEAALDFFAYTGYVPCSLDYGCINVENMVLSFMTASKKLFKAHGTPFKMHVRKNYRLQTMGMGELTGMDGFIELLFPEYVYVTILHRHFVCGEAFEHKDRLKFVPVHAPPTGSSVLSSFNVRRGILLGTSFMPTYSQLVAIPPEVVSGKVKAIARIEGHRKPTQNSK